MVSWPPVEWPARSGAPISPVLDAVLGRLTSMIRTLILSACAALLPIGLAPGAASAGGVTLPLSPVGAPELTAPSFNAYSNWFDTTKGKGSGDDGMFYFTPSSPEKVAILFSAFSVSDMKNNVQPQDRRRDHDRFEIL